MTKKEIIVRLVCSLNEGKSYMYKDVTERVAQAVYQYEEMVRLGIIEEEEKQ